MNKIVLILLLSIHHLPIFSLYTEDSIIINKKNNACKNVIGICYNKKSLNFIFDSSIVQLCCDTLPQVKFWEKVLDLSPDSAILNIAYNRKSVQTVNIKWWYNQSDEYRDCYRDSIRQCYQLPDSARVSFTTGKKHYYKWDNIFIFIDKAIQIFSENDVDPWYAQSILLIESPMGNLRSPKGARGYFQLMKNVARKFGLKVTRHYDERLHFDRAAYAAAMLIKTICIPEMKKILDTLNISYNENEIWFKLLVMHVYHAGAYNVKAALLKKNCVSPSMEMIYCLWQTRTKGFQTASQNYSQLILTAHIKAYKKLGLLQCFRP